jgi:hypothetical protein
MPLLTCSAESVETLLELDFQPEKPIEGGNICGLTIWNPGDAFPAGMHRRPRRLYGLLQFIQAWSYREYLQWRREGELALEG